MRVSKSSNSLAVRRALAVARMRARAWPLPAGYAFDRDDANAR